MSRPFFVCGNLCKFMTKAKKQTAADIKACVDNWMLHLLLVRKVHACVIMPDGFPCQSANGKFTCVWLKGKFSFHMDKIASDQSGLCLCFFPNACCCFCAHRSLCPSTRTALLSVCLFYPGAEISSANICECHCQCSHSLLVTLALMRYWHRHCCLNYVHSFSADI